MIKKLSLLLAIVMMFTACMALSSCGPETGEEDGDDPLMGYTTRLSVRMSDDGDYYTITGFGAFEGSKVKVEETFSGKPIKEIASNAFNSPSAQEQLVEIIFSKNIFKVADAAFYGCKNLKSVTLNQGIQRIEKSAFSRCSSLTSINLPEGLEYIGDNAFQSCSSLPLIYLPTTIKHIGKSAFAGTSTDGAYIHGQTIAYVATTNHMAWIIAVDETIADVNLPNNSVGIAASAFSGCDKLVTVEIPSGVKYICENAFAGCTSLTTINYGGTAEEFKNIVIESGNEAFLNANVVYGK